MNRVAYLLLFVAFPLTVAAVTDAENIEPATRPVPESARTIVERYAGNLAPLARG